MALKMSLPSLFLSFYLLSSSDAEQPPRSLTSSLMITPGHALELLRLELIDWSRYPPVTHVRKVALGKYERKVGSYNNMACFSGCAPLNASMKDDGDSPPDGSRWGPGTLSVVIPWCCESDHQFILRDIDFKGHLRELFVYQKCASSGKACVAPTRESLTADIGANEPGDVAKLRIHILDMQEPGRRHCMSTDECGAYLLHMTSKYDSLTDGIFFMQGDPEHFIIKSSVQRVVDWVHTAGVAPIAFYPLGSKKGAGGDPVTCLRAWQHLLFDHDGQEASAWRTGNYRNGIFYASRLVVRQRPRAFWHGLFSAINITEWCAPVVVAECKAKEKTAEEAQEEEQGGRALRARADLSSQEGGMAPMVRARHDHMHRGHSARERHGGHIASGPPPPPPPPPPRSAAAKHPPAGYCNSALATVNPQPRSTVGPSPSGGGLCIKSCSALEHVWSQMLCQPCHSLDKNSDPRFPFNEEETRNHAQPPVDHRTALPS